MLNPLCFHHRPSQKVQLKNSLCLWRLGWRLEVTLGYFSSGAIHLVLRHQVSHWTLTLARPGRLAPEPQRFPHSCFPGAGVTSVCVHTWLFTWVLGTEFGARALCAISSGLNGGFLTRILKMLYIQNLRVCGMFSVFTNVTEMHTPFLSAVDPGKEPRWAASVELVLAVTHLPWRQL